MSAYQTIVQPLTGIYHLGDVGLRREEQDDVVDWDGRYLQQYLNNYPRAADVLIKPCKQFLIFRCNQ